LSGVNCVLDTPASKDILDQVGPHRGGGQNWCQGVRIARLKGEGKEGNRNSGTVRGTRWKGGVAPQISEQNQSKRKKKKQGGKPGGGGQASEEGKTL